MRSRVIARNQAEHGQAALDIYTPLHFAAGLVAGIYGVSPVKAALVLTIVKIGVASIEHGTGHGLFHRARGESNLNELCDLLAEIAGVDVGAKIRGKWDPEPDWPAAGSQPLLPSPAPAAPASTPPVVPAPAPPAVSGIFRLR